MYRGVDERQYEEVVAQYAPHGIWHRQGKALSGRDAIMAAMNARTPTQVTRHVLSNFVVTALASDRAMLACYLHTYVHDSGQVQERPIAIRSATRLLLVAASMVVSEGRWRIEELRTRPEFDFRND